jgi:hypothetical protein
MLRQSVPYSAKEPIMIPQSAYTSLPQAYAGKIIEPDRIESYKDAENQGLWACFYYHTYSVIEDRIVMIARIS